MSISYQEYRGKKEDELYAAFEKKDMNKVKDILDELEDDQVVLGHAAIHGDKELVEYMLKRPGIDINANSEEYTPLGWALEIPNIDIVKLLLAQPNIDVNQVHHHGKQSGYPYWEWVMGEGAHGREAAKLLFAHPSFNPNQVSFDKEPVISYLMGSKYYEDELKKFLANPNTDVNATYINEDGDVISPLISAFERRAQEMVNLLVKHPKIIFSGNVLVYAVKNKKENLLNYILKNPRVNVNKPDINGDIPAFVAMKYYNKDILKRLLDHPSVDVSVRNKDGKTLEDLAKEEDNEELLKIIKNKKMSSRGLAEIAHQANFPPEITSLIYEQATGTKPSLKNYFDNQRDLIDIDLDFDINERDQMLLDIKNKKKLNDEETQKYQERIAREKEAAEKKKQADKNFQARQAMMLGRDIFPVKNTTPSSTEFIGNNPRNKGGRKTKKSKKTTKKTRRN